jgi:hypothetical protein
MCRDEVLNQGIIGFKPTLWEAGVQEAVSNQQAQEKGDFGQLLEVC